MTREQRDALAVFAPAAVAAEIATGYPAAVTVAQWAVETGWSLSNVTGDCNLFGLTAATYPLLPKKFCATSEEMTAAQFALLPADERASERHRMDLGHGVFRIFLSRWFACFDSLADGVARYIAVITAPGHRYSASWTRYKLDGNVDALIDGIARAGYATGAGYSALLKSIAHEGPVVAALAAARTKAETSI